MLSADSDNPGVEPSGIHICWPADEGSDIQEALFQIARHGWILILIKCYHESSSSRNSEIRFRLSLYTESTDSFKEFGSILIAYFAETQIAEFIEWITRHVRTTLSEMDIVTDLKS